MKSVAVFVIRWVFTSIVLWVGISTFGTGIEKADTAYGISVYAIGGLLLSLLNLSIKPIITILTLPITILTLGLFMLVINGMMVYFAILLTPSISITFTRAILVGLLIAVINAAVNRTLIALRTVR
jgi:putative membrane protein